MPEMTREQLEGAVMALDAFADTFHPVKSAEEDWAFGLVCALADTYRAQLAALPPQARLYRGACGVCRSEYEVNEPHKSGVLCPECRESGRLACGVVHFHEVTPPEPDLRAALVEARAALDSSKCRCGQALNTSCPNCGDNLIAVRYSGYLNSDQWDAIKGGDWYCNSCTDPSIVNGKKHWHDHELSKVAYQQCEKCAALDRIDAALEGTA